MKKFLLLSAGFVLVLAGCMNAEQAEEYTLAVTDAVEAGEAFSYSETDTDGWTYELLRDENSNYSATIFDTTDTYSAYLVDGTLQVCLNDDCAEDTDIDAQAAIDSAIADFTDYVLDTYSGDYTLSFDETDEAVTTTVDIVGSDGDTSIGTESYTATKDGSNLTVSFTCDDESGDECSFSYDQTITIGGVEEIKLPS